MKKIFNVIRNWFVRRETREQRFGLVGPRIQLERMGRKAPLILPKT